MQTITIILAMMFGACFGFIVAAFFMGNEINRLRRRCQLFEELYIAACKSDARRDEIVNAWAENNRKLNEQIKRRMN